MKIGLLGYGFGGRVFHAPLIASAPSCDFLGVVVRDPAKRAELPDGLAGFASLQELAAAGADAVAISAPAQTHTTLVPEALSLGLAVACDKPFATNADDAQSMVDLADRLGRPLTVYQNRRFDSDFLTVRRLAGTLGSPRRFESRFERFKPSPGPKPAGGGGLLDFGTHLFDQALLLLGPVTHVYAEANVRDNGLDDDFFAALTHRDGGISHLSGSWVAGGTRARLRVTGTTPPSWWPTSRARRPSCGPVIPRRASATAGVSEPQRTWGAIHRADVAQPMGPERGRWDTFYPEFAAAVERAPRCRSTPTTSSSGLALIDAARDSAATHTTVQL